VEQAAQRGYAASVPRGFEARIMSTALSNLFWTCSWPYCEHRVGL